MPASAASNRPEDLAERLDGASGEGETLLKALREVKNQIIGNKTKKLLYLHLGAIPKIVSILASAVDSAGASAAPLIVQSAAALGSFASGLDACARAVLDAGAVPHLMRVLYNSDEKVVDAGARSLRMIFQSKLAPKYDVLKEKNMQFLLSLLNSVNENVIELAASIIMHSCETSTEQKALCDAGVLHRLFGLLEGSLNQRDASLDSIAVIVKNNCDVVSKFSCIGNGKALSAIIELVEDRYPRTRLLACVCLIAIGHASPWHMQESEVKMKLILILVELLEEPGRPGDEAPFALADLIADKDLHEHAISVNAVEKLCNFLHKSSIEAKRLQGILLALAELCSKLEKCRCQIMLMQVLKLIVDALMHDCADVRIAACTCIKSISRSVKNLSAGRLSGESIVLPLIQLLHDPSTSVQVAALCAFCNVVVDFTPQKFIFFQHGCVKELVHLSNSTDSRLKLNAIWALRNLMFLADRISKEGILLELTELTLASLICDQEPFVQEQALGLVRNLVDGHIGSVEHVFAKDGIVIDAVARQVRFSSTPEVCIQGMFVLSNIASGNEFHKELVMSYLLPPQADLPAFIIKFLQNNNSLLRTASIWCIVNLTYPDCPGSIVRVTRLRDAGIMFQVKTMVNDPCLDVKYRVRMALEQCLIFEHSGV